MRLIREVHYKKMKEVITSYKNSLKTLYEMKKGIPDVWYSRCQNQRIRLLKLEDYLTKRAKRRGFTI